MAASADGYIRINTKIDQTGAKTGLASLGKSLKGFAVAAGLAFGVAAVTKFAKSCIDLASDLNEVQNVVDVTFGTSAQKINNFAKTAATSFGLSELSAKKYTGTMGAMLKSMGFAQGAAADMSIEMASLAGDMASFYNLSTDEAFEKIRSGISGETEPLKQLGVNLSEANLQAYALAQGITQGYSSMSEQNKALIRYNYLLDATSDAQGDFSRTSGSWANQVRVLQLQWDSLKATLGGPFIAALTPVLAFINRILGALQAAAAAFASFISLITGTQQTVATSAGAAAGALDDTAASADAAGNAAAGAGKKAKKGLASFDELNVLSDSSGGGGGGGGGGLDLSAATKDTEKQATAMDKTKAQMEKFFSWYREEIGLIKDSWGELTKTVTDFWSGFSKQASETDILGAGFKAAASFVYAFLEVLNLVIDAVGDLILAFNIPATVESALNFLAAVFKSIGDVVDAVTPGIMAFIDKGIAPIVEWIGVKLRDALAFLSEQLGVVGDWFQAHKEDFTVIGQYLGEVAAAIWKVLEPLASGIWEAIKFIISSTLDILLALAGWAIDGAVWLINSWYAIHDAALSVFGGISKFLSDTWTSVWNTITTTWDGIKQYFSDILAGISKTFNDTVTGIQTAWGAVAKWFTDNVITPITTAFDAFKLAIQGVWDGLWGGIKGVINSIMAGIETFVNGIVDGVNRLISELNGIITLGGKVAAFFGMEGVATVGTWNRVSLPRLAQGAVIPPNREFAAILGDQRSGTNIETPLDTMIAAFKTALGEMGGAGNNRPIYITVESKLDGKTVARNQARYLPKEYNRIGPTAVRVGG